MRVKAVFFDLDGTLLREDKSVSAYSLDVLARCREQGILFFPTTARPPRALDRRFITELPWDGAICHNGGVVVLHGQAVWNDGIPSETALELAHRILKEFPGIRLSAEINDRLYTNFDGQEIWQNVGSEYVFTDFSTLPDAPLDKLIVGLDVPGVYETVCRLLPPGLAAQISDNKIVTVQPKDVEKGRAVKAVCKKLGFSPAETVGFGDDWNDISLLKTCGVGVAVANALPEVKKAADGLCPSNEEDGPARWLEEHVLH